MFKKGGFCTRTDVGQIMRYMGKVRENLASDTQSVKGCIVALENDEKLRASLRVIDNLDFYRYRVDFKFLLD